MQKQAIYFLSAACLTFCLHAAEDQSEYGQYKSQKQSVKPHHKEVKVTQKQRTDNCMNYYGYGAFTYWNGQVNDVFYALVNDTPTNTPATVPMYQAKTRPGFIVGAGLYCNTNKFDANVQYTWFYNKQDKGLNKLTSFTVTGDTEYQDDFQTVGGSLANTFNRLDLTLNKLIYFNESFKLTTGGGIVGNWSQFWEDVKLSNNTLDADRTQTTQGTQNIWGAGPYARFMSSFMIPVSMLPSWSHFSLYVSAGTGFNWNNTKYTQYNTDTNTVESTADLKFNVNNMRQLLDGCIGFRWEMLTNEYPVNAFADIGWQVQNWSGYYSSFGFLSRDYFMQGLTATVGIDF